ncbi:hypothetical protein [Mycobacterium numidiamassiliense]|uniref:hypothetical protein n=1 Tax=Mycobacterium numidiamassiliense TaxID=1841861 RepID=UPI001054E17B|nr:hypothetical protein [Mycobacterium numidiamassiliense]
MAARAACRLHDVAGASLVFANRIRVAAALSRIELFKMVMDVLGAIIECGVYRCNSLMPYIVQSSDSEPSPGSPASMGKEDPKDIDATMFSDTDPR